MKAKNAILIFFFICLSAGSSFLVSTAFVNAETVPKWYCTLFAGLTFVSAYVLFSFFVRDTRAEVDKILSCFCAVIAIVCTAQALYGIVQYLGILPAANGFRVTGSFDNPAGFAATLCTGFPFMFVFVSDKKTWIKGLSVAAGLILITAVLLSASRAGIISLFTIGIFVLFYKFKIKTSRKIIVFFAAFVISLSGLYFLKKDSADGRLFIWTCTWEMIKDKPLLGYGTRGFKANYMHYQAAYFEENTDSQFAMLADNVNRPFNEYLLIMVNYGLVGLSILLIVCWFLWKSYARIHNKDILVRASVWYLLSIAVFAMFSYPLRYPFVWVAGVLSVFALISRAEYSMTMHFVWSLSLRIILIPLLIAITVKAYGTMSAEIQWNETAGKSLLGKTEAMLPMYKKLYSQLHDNELFLYNYAAELNVAKHYEESLHIATECERLWADYDLTMLMADNCLKMQRYAEAEQYYRKTSAMCPVKFMPLYKLVELYLTTGRDEEARNLAQKILDKEVKINSLTIHSIKNKMATIIMSATNQD